MGSSSGVFDAKPEGFRFLAEGLPLFVFFGLLALIFWKMLFSGGSVISPYLFSVNHPWAEFLRRNMAHGDFPLWNPHLFSGVPFFSDPKSALLYPFSYIFAALPYNAALFYSLALHTTMAAFFTYVFCRLMQIAPSGALAAAVLYAFGGTLTLSALEINKLWAMSWLPLTLVFVHKSQENGSYFAAFCASITCVLAFFAGSASSAFFIALAAILYWLWLGQGMALSKIGAFVLFGALLSSVLLLPAMSRHSMLGLHHQAGWTLPYSISFRDAAIMFLSPLWSFHHAAPSTAFFCGLSGLALALLGLRNWKTPWLPFAVLTLTGLVFALGGNLPAFETVMRLPVLSWVGDPSSALCLCAFGMAVLSGLGIESLRVSPLRPLLALVCLVECAIFAVKAVPNVPHGVYEATSPAIEFLAEHGALNGKNLPLLSSHAEARGDYQLMTAAAATAPMARNFISADGPSFIVPPASYAGVLTAAKGPQGGKWISLLGINHAAGNNGSNANFVPVEGAPETIYGNPKALPRFRFAKTLLCANDAVAARRLADATQDDLVQFAYAQDSCAAGPVLNYRDPAAVIELTGHTSDSFMVTVKTPFSGYLLVNENWDKGWHATVNRRRAKVLRADLYQKAVAVPAGESEIVFTYTPPLLWLGATLSLLSLFGLGATLLMSGSSEDFRRPSRRSGGLNLEVLSVHSGARRTKWGRS